MQNQDVESSINQLLQLKNNELFRKEINLLNGFYNDYYSKRLSTFSVEVIELLDFILIQTINNLNDKLNIKNSTRLLFKPSDQQALTSNQLLSVYEVNNKKYLDNLRSKLSNKIFISLNNEQDDSQFEYHIEQYKVEENESVYLDKLRDFEYFIFNDYDTELEYKFHIIIYKRKNHLKIPFKNAYYSIGRNEWFHKFNISLLDITTNNELTKDFISLFTFRCNFFLDLINNYKINQTCSLINVIMQLIDENQIEKIINNNQIKDLNETNDLIININSIKIKHNDGYYYLDLIFQNYSGQTAILQTDQNEFVHLKDVNYEMLLENSQQCLSIRVNNYNLKEKLITQCDYKLKILEYLDNSCFLSIDNDVLSLSLKFQLNSKIKISTSLMNLDLKPPFDESMLDICLKCCKMDQDFDILHLKKALVLVSNHLKLNNEPKKSLISEKLFKLIIKILSSVKNLDEISTLQIVKDNNLCKFLMQNLKTIFDVNDSSIANEAEFILLLRAFHVVVNLIVKLMSCENFKLSLKYDLNYIFMKIGKKNYKKKYFVFSFLNFEFISNVYNNNIFSINEIYEIICFKMFNDLTLRQLVTTTDVEINEFNSYFKLIEEIILEKFLFSKNFSMLITQNYEFRFKFIRFIVNNFLSSGSFKVDVTKLNIIFHLINEFNYKFDKKEFKLIFKSVLKTFEISYKCNISLPYTELKFESDSKDYSHDFKLFLCLIDLLMQSVSITSIQQLNNYFDNLKLADYIFIFQLFSYFLECKLHSNLKLVWSHVYDVLSQYLALIFKYILRMIAISTIESTSNEVTVENEIEILLISYFKLEFLLNQHNIVNDLNQINGYLIKYKCLNEFLMRNLVKLLLNNELAVEEFVKLTDYLCTCCSNNQNMMKILVAHEILEGDYNSLIEKKLDKPIFELIELCFDYTNSKKTNLIECKILTFKLYQVIARIKLDSTEEINKIKFQIEYMLIKKLIKLNEPNYYEIIVLYKNKLDLLNKCLSNSVTSSKNDEMEKFYYLSLFKYLCLYELSALMKPQQDINLIKITNKSIYNQLFQIYKQVYKFFIKNSNNFKLVEYINLKLNELNLKINSNNESFKHIEEKMLFKNTYYYFCIGFFSNINSNIIHKSINNRYFLYTSKTNEMLTTIQKYILGNFDSSKTPMQVLNLNQDPFSKLLSSNSMLYVQIFALKNIEKDDLIKILDETLDGDELNENKAKIENENLKFFYYDKPFFKNLDNNNIENLWIERSIMSISESDSVLDFIEYFNEFIEIKCLTKLFLQPIQNAINDCTEKTIELRDFINNFTFNAINFACLSNKEIMSKLQPLTMRLLGCLDGKILINLRFIFN